MENYQFIILVGTNISIFIGFISSVVALHIHLSKSLAKSNKEFNEKMYALELKNRRATKGTDKKAGRPKGSKNRR